MDRLIFRCLVCGRIADDTVISGGGTVSIEDLTNNGKDFYTFCHCGNCEHSFLSNKYLEKLCRKIGEKWQRGEESLKEG